MEETEELLEDDNGKSVTVARILDIAFELFAARGIEPVTMEDIAQKAKIAPAPLYRYFESKDNLVVRTATQAWITQMEDVLPNIVKPKYTNSTGYAQLEQIFILFVKLYEKHQDFLRFIYLFDAFAVKEKIHKDQMTNYESKILLVKEIISVAIQKGIASIAVHTNLDKADGGVNDCLCKNLHLTNCKPICNRTGRAGILQKEMSPMDFAQHVKDCLGTSVQVKVGKNSIKTVAVVSGGGGEFLQDALDEGKADAFVTGEMKHHMWLKVKDATCVVAGHYATENVVVSSLCSLLNEKLPDVEWLCYLGEAPYQTV